MRVRLGSIDPRMLLRKRDENNGIGQSSCCGTVIERTSHDQEVMGEMIKPEALTSSTWSL